MASNLAKLARTEARQSIRRWAFGSASTELLNLATWWPIRYRFSQGTVDSLAVSSSMTLNFDAAPLDRSSAPSAPAVAASGYSAIPVTLYLPEAVQYHDMSFPPTLSAAFL